MIRSLNFTPSGVLNKDLDISAFPAALREPQGLLWVDFEATPPESDEPILREVFGFHPLAIDDALQESHVPKVDDWVDYLYIVLHSVTFDKTENAHIDTLELDIFLGQNYLITHHDQSIAAINHVWEDCQRDMRPWKNGVDHLLYKVTDEVVASYFPVVEDLDDEIDRVEDQVFDKPTTQIVERIFALKRAVLRLRRIIGPQREVLNKLARDDYKAIDAKSKVYFRDVYDHLARLYDITESVRDLVSGALDTYLSVMNNRMNDIMKTLTVITTMFMPISFLVGFFGMNFFMPIIPMARWVGRPAFLVVLLLTVMTPLGIFLWIRRRGWM